jgi:hypothetical protein
MIDWRQIPPQGRGSARGLARDRLGLDRQDVVRKRHGGSSVSRSLATTVPHALQCADSGDDDEVCGKTSVVTRRRMSSEAGGRPRFLDVRGGLGIVPSTSPNPCTCGGSMATPPARTASGTTITSSIERFTGVIGVSSPHSRTGVPSVTGGRESGTTWQADISAP